MQEEVFRCIYSIESLVTEATWWIKRLIRRLESKILRYGYRIERLNRLVNESTWDILAVIGRFQGLGYKILGWKIQLRDGNQNIAT